MTKLNDKQWTEEELQTVKALRAGWEQLERQFPVSSPDASWLVGQIEGRKRRNRRLLVRDLSLFGVTAIVVLFGLAAALVNVPAVFIAAQAVSLFVAPFVLAPLWRKRVSE